MIDTIEEKIKFYKDQIIQKYIQQGIYPNNNIIAKELENIDTNLALFKYTKINKGNTFNTDNYNIYIKNIYNDLTILYKTLYDITNNQFQDLQNFANTHINQLEDYVDKYKYRADMEMISTALGNSILFQNSNFNIIQNNDLSIISLDKINIHEGSNIYCLVDIANIDPNKIYFELRESQIDYTNPSNINGFCKRSNIYNYNQDFINIPILTKIDDIVYDTIYTSTDNTINSLVILPIKDTINNESKYKIFGGKNLVSIKSINDTNDLYTINTIDLPNKELKTESIIEFYILNGDTVSFNFSKQPIKTNFKMDSNFQVTGLDDIQFFQIYMPSNSVINIKNNKGNIFACNTDAIIKNDSIYTNNPCNLYDFTVVKISQKNPITLYPYVILSNNDNTYDLKSIMIKEIPN